MYLDAPVGLASESLLGDRVVHATLAAERDRSQSADAKPVVYVPIDDDEISRGVIIQVVIGFERYSLIADRTGYRHVMLQLEIGLDLWLGLVARHPFPVSHEYFRAGVNRFGRFLRHIHHHLHRQAVYVVGLRGFRAVLEAKAPALRP